MFELQIISGPDEHDGTPYWGGRITLGAFSEDFQADARFWDAAAYRAQWYAAARRLASAGERTVFLTSFRGLDAGYQFSWPAWREGARVYFQNRLLLAEQLDPPFALEHLDSYAGVRRSIGEDGDELSEWYVEARDLEEYVQRVGQPVPA